MPAVTAKEEMNVAVTHLKPRARKASAGYTDFEHTGSGTLAGRLTLTDVVDHPYLAVIEDVVAQGGQGTTADRSQERLGRSDTGIIAMRKIWSREMRALAEGRLTKQWQPLLKMPE